MDFLFLVAITLKITGTLQKKTSSSDESVENILYYKDCNKQATVQPAPMIQVPFRHEEPPPPPPKPPECVPKMCCSMSCANTCGQNQENAQPMISGMQPGHEMLGRQMSSPNNMPMSSMMQPMMQAMQENHQPQQPLIPFNQRARKKKTLKKPMTRRNLGFTRDHIKTLISHDEDIKKILKDLVRVTMQKVDLVDLINSRRSSNRMAQVNRNVRNYYASAVNKKEEEEETNRLMQEEN